MTKIILFLCSTIIFQVAINSAIAAPETTQTQSSPSPEQIDGIMLSPDAAIEAADFEQIKIDYYGNAESAICVAKKDEECRHDGACCSGGTQCTLILKKLKQHSSIFANFFITNFCK